MRAYALVLLLTPFAAAAAVAGRPGLLLRWYLRIVRRMRVPEDRGERIASYPLA